MRPNAEFALDWGVGGVGGVGVGGVGAGVGTGAAWSTMPLIRRWILPPATQNKSGLWQGTDTSSGGMVVQIEDQSCLFGLQVAGSVARCPLAPCEIKPSTTHRTFTTVKVGAP